MRYLLLFLLIPYVVAADDFSLCTNGILDRGETDVDCGGNGCRLCGDGNTCNYGENCASNTCEQGVCVSCFDGTHNNEEEGIDCGSKCGVKCATQGVLGFDVAQLSLLAGVFLLVIALIIFIVTHTRKHAKPPINTRPIPAKRLVQGEDPVEQTIQRIEQKRQTYDFSRTYINTPADEVVEPKKEKSYSRKDVEQIFEK